MSGGEKAGMTAALEVTGAGEPPKESAEQLPLLPSMASEPVPERQEAEFSRGRGRPKGSKNKRTKETVDYIGGRYGFPLERLAQLYSADPQQLAKSLKIDVEKAVDVMKSAAIAALPYMHQKQPVAVDFKGKGTIQLVIGDVGQEQIEEATEHGLSLVIDANVTDAEIVEDQEVSEGDG